MKTPLLLSTLAALALLPLPARAGSVTLTGNTAGGPTFNRPTETGALSLFEAVPYNAYVFTVSLSGAYDFSLSAVNPANYDTFLHLYVGRFNPATPDQNFLRANDDANGNTTNSGLAGVNLLTGTNYFFVLDGFSNQDAGAYNAGISGPGNITAAAVPEPSTFALLGVAVLLGGGSAVRRRRLAAKSA